MSSEENENEAGPDLEADGAEGEPGPEEAGGPPAGDAGQESGAGVPGQDRPPTEEELRAAYEAELKALRVEEVVAQTVVSLLNLGARKAGLLPGSEDEADADQVALAVESVRRLLPLVEPALGESAGQIKDALSQLQVAYARLAGEDETPGGEGPAGESGDGEGGSPPAGGPGEGPAGGGPAGAGGSGLWVPGR